MKEDELTFRLERFAYTPMGTFGRWQMEEFECYTVERPWALNLPRESCIPEGRYSIVLDTYNRGGYECLHILEVPGRSLIKVHAGNTMKDLLGCVAPGKDLGWVSGHWGVVGSKNTLAALLGRVHALRETVPGTINPSMFLEVDFINAGVQVPDMMSLLAPKR